MGKVISLMNEKGGVGKSALTFACAWHIASTGKRVLLIDMDGQMANLSYLAGIKTNTDTLTIQNVLMKDISIKETIQRVTAAPDGWQFDIVPATVDMVGLTHTAKIRKMRLAVGEIAGDYDYVFLDVNPSPDWRHALTLSVLDAVCVVMKPDVLSLEANRGIFDSITEIQESTNHDLKVVGFILNCYDPRTNLGKAVTDKVLQMAEYYGTSVLNTRVRNAVAFSESAKFHVGVTDYAPDSGVAGDIRALANEIMENAE